MLQWFQEFGNLINTGLILLLGGLLVRSLRAHIGLLEGQLKVAEMFAAKNVNEQFEALHAQFESLQQRYDDSIKKYLEATQEHARLAKEMLAKTSAFDSRVIEMSYGTDPRLDSRQGTDACGLYRIVGHNPYDERAVYVGEVRIREHGHALRAEWTVEAHWRRQKYQGVGIRIGPHLAFGFPYTSDISTDVQIGVVLYVIQEPNLMRGYWTGPGSHDLGFEECRKISE
jgi:hypothetical protein